MLWKPKSPAIIRALAEAFDEFGNLRIGGGCPAPRRMMMAASGAAAGYRFFRCDVTANNGDGSFMAIGEFEIMVNGTAHPTSNMTSDSAPSPLVASASSVQSSNDAFKAFDGSVGAAKWQANATTGWVKVDLGVGNEIDPTSFKLSSADVANRMAKDFTFEGSNTGDFSGEEDVLKTVTNETGWSIPETREYTR